MTLRDAAPRRDASTETHSTPNHAQQKNRGFWLIVGIFIGLLVVALGASWAAIDVVNATRAYATGEGRYSKAQKIAVLSLHRYVETGRAADRARFHAAIAVPVGDRTARLALERTPPDIASATAGFLAGENHPDDIPGLIRLFLWAGWWEPFAAAVQDWRDADRLVEALAVHASELDAHMVAGTLGADRRAVLMGEIERIDHQLTVLETTFTNHIGDAARAATTLVIIGLGLTTVLLWVVGMGFAWRLFARQVALDRQLGFSERRFRDYAEVASDWYWETDAAAGMTYISERYFAITGIAPEKALQRNALEFVRAHSTGDENRGQLDAFHRREPFRDLRLCHTRPDGQTFYWSLSGKPHCDAAGRYLGYRGVGSEITAQVKDAQILREAKTRAEVANRIKSEFLANMSHELRTPLNAIMGFAEIIAGRLLGAQAIERYANYASDIHRSGQHLLSIIDDILDLAKIEAGRAGLQESEVTLGELAAGTRMLMGGRIEEAGLTFEVRLARPSLRLRIDERKLKQVLVNLLSNALKFTPAGGRITLTADLAGDGGATIEVHDTGIGIAPEHQEIAMSAFGQIESAFSRQHHGTGLGLPLARSLIELHGGRLSLDSLPGRGTAVALWLPSSRVVRQAALDAAE